MPEVVNWHSVDCIHSYEFVWDFLLTAYGTRVFVGLVVDLGAINN